MSRPTPEQVDTALDHLNQLGHRQDSKYNPNGFPDIASAIDLFLFVDTERDHARAAAAYPAGTDAHTIGRHGLHRPVEDRFHWGNGSSPHLRDPLYRTLTAAQRTMLHQLGQDVDRWMQQAQDAANWPKHTQDTG